MPGTATQFPSGLAGRTGRLGGARLQVAGASRFKPRPFREVSGQGGTFNSAFAKVRQLWLITGRTLDSAGAALPGATVTIFTTPDNLPRASTTSDSLGNYSFSVDGNSQTRFCVSYLAGPPDVAGTTVNSLLPVLT